VNENRGAGLWDSAAASGREILEKKEPGDKRTERRDEYSTPSLPACGVHPSCKLACQENEGDDDKSNNGADDKAQNQRELVLLLAKIFDQLAETVSQLCESHRRILQVE
jgi:hypothetical protein